MCRTILPCILIGIIGFFNTCYSNNSQKRLPNESYQHALNRIYKSDSAHLKSLNNSPANSKVPIDALDYSRVPEVSTYAELLQMFHMVRDSRFLYSEQDPSFSRRISWLYPDDGCYARAALSGIKLAENRLVRPSKIFVFGDLTVQTPYSLDGVVYWWYHVAEIVQFNQVYYVLDPALHSQEPLTLDHWLHIMGQEQQLKGSICNTYTYGPFDDCLNATQEIESTAQSDELEYLDEEWKRIRQLGFDPALILGDNPPWLQGY